MFYPCNIAVLFDIPWIVQADDEHRPGTSCQEREDQIFVLKQKYQKTIGAVFALELSRIWIFVGQYWGNDGSGSQAIDPSGSIALMSRFLVR